MLKQIEAINRKLSASPSHDMSVLTGIGSNELTRWRKLACGASEANEGIAICIYAIGVIQRGAARACFDGSGLDVTPECAIISTDGRASARIFGVGPVTSGVFCNGRPRFCLQVAHVLSRTPEAPW